MTGAGAAAAAASQTSPPASMPGKHHHLHFCLPNSSSAPRAAAALWLPHQAASGLLTYLVTLNREWKLKDCGLGFGNITELQPEQECP
jgi:hypothetical protein